MKYARKLTRLQARRQAWDALDNETKDATKRPGSFKKTGGTKARHGLASATQRSRTAVNK